MSYKPPFLSIRGTKRLLVLFIIMAVISLGVLASDTHTALAQVTVYTDQILFENATGAIEIPIPDGATAFPGVDCGLPGTGRGQQIQIPFDSNNLTVIVAHPPFPLTPGGP